MESTHPTDSEKSKESASLRAVELVEDNMKLGLGTGSTAAVFVRCLADRVRDEGLNLLCVPTSSRTRDLAESLGLKVGILDDVGWLDLVIDGADEFDGDLNLIKGGGGALLQEKIVATASDRMVVIADDTKQVDTLGAFPLPVEVIQFGWQTTKAILEDTLAEAELVGRSVTRRMDGDTPFITDEGHYIVDLHLDKIPAPRLLGILLNQIPGVVEHGLFVDIADAVIIGHPSGEAKLIKAPTDGAT